MQRLGRSLCVLVTTAFAAGNASAPAAAATESTPQAIARLVESAKHPTMRFGSFPDMQLEARRFYEARAYGAAWLAEGRPTQAATLLLVRLSAVADVGLDPADYDADRLTRTARSYSSGRAPDAQEAARFDLAITLNALRLFSAMRFGRVSPTRAHGTLTLPRPDERLAARLDSVAGGTMVDPILEALQPRFRHYHLLLRSLARYRALAGDSSLVPLPPLPKKLAPGDRWEGTPRLRALLDALGDLGDSARSAGPPPLRADSTYDAALVEAVETFQRRNGLKADGVIGGQTVARLNRPFGERIRQIELTLERWRWLPRDYSAPPIFVNIPAFRLHAFRDFDDNEETMLSMDVVVGTAYKHDTPIFSAPLTYVVLSPFWEVPASIASREIRPKARRAPSYLAREHFVLVRGQAEVPATRENIDALGGAVRVRQKPGPWNSLGRVKFMLPNPYNIYLHDTPSKGRFEAERRDFSHGCIRLSQPLELAEFVLRDQPQWTGERIEVAMAADTPTQIYLSKAIPVYVLYGTAIGRQDGRTYFFADLYGHDRTLDDLLRRGYPYPQ